MKNQPLKPDNQPKVADDIAEDKSCCPHFSDMFKRNNKPKKQETKIPKTSDIEWFLQNRK